MGRGCLAPKRGYLEAKGSSSRAHRTNKAPTGSKIGAAGMIAIGPWELRKPALHSAGGVVASQSRRAAAAGGAIVEEGGDAVDEADGTGVGRAAVVPWVGRT